jgi:hypothetical protein
MDLHGLLQGQLYLAFTNRLVSFDVTQSARKTKKIDRTKTVPSNGGGRINRPFSFDMTGAAQKTKTN